VVIVDRLALAFILLVALSCSKNSSVEFSDNQAIVQPSNLSIDRVSLLDWKVGPDRKQTVSRGFIVALTVPGLSKSDLKRLVDEHQVDSWYFQIRRGNEVLQRYFVPLSMGSRQMRSVNFNVQYAASAISMRFYNSPCPTFNHQKIITEHRQVNVQRNTDRLTLGRLHRTRAPGQMEAFEIRPPSINGGNTLRGVYQFDIAFFSSADRSFRSNLLTYPMAVQISSEREGNIRGCEGYVIPEEQSGSINEFRFGR
jgi:hypothetical protein